MNIDLLTLFLFLTGVGQVIMMAAVIPLPRWLNWRDEAAKLGKVTRQVFWIYAGYIFTTNVAIGLLTLAFADELISATPLVASLTGFMFLYWAARLVLQLFVIYKEAAPQGMLFTVGEKLLTALFLFFTATYAWAFGHNLLNL